MQICYKPMVQEERLELLTTCFRQYLAPTARKRVKSSVKFIHMGKCFQKNAGQKRRLSEDGSLKQRKRCVFKRISVDKASGKVFSILSTAVMMLITVNVKEMRRCDGNT